ncbi:hypothetical protein BOX15_Mlig011547g5, partial [Macrostomum lignano]
QEQYFYHLTLKCLNMSGANKSTIWFFGYGSNMDSENLSKKKGVEVLQSTPAVLRGYKMAFSLAAIPLAEPFFANCEKGSESDNIHGVAFETDADSIAKMDKVEMGYDKASVILEAYDGRKLDGYVYVNKPQREVRVGNPSGRYLRLLINGAKAAGLNKDYIARLEATPVYKPSAETLAKRAALTSATYPTKEMTQEALGKDLSHFVSVFGYIIDAGPSTGFFSSHRGKDITNRMLRHYLNLPLDSVEDPQDAEHLPNLKLLESRPDAVDFVWTWFDQHASSGTVVARHAAFLAAQEVDSSTGKPRSQWTIPTA